MMKFQAALRYEMARMLKALGALVATAVALMGAVTFVSHAFGLYYLSFGSMYSFAVLFLVFWTAIAFGRDSRFFLQSGLARRQVFAVFAAVAAAEALAFALIDGVLSLALPDFWAVQSWVLGKFDGYSAALLAHVLLLNLAAAFSALAVAALQKRIGSGWTALLVFVLAMTVFSGVPALFSLFPGGTESLGAFVAAFIGSPYAPEPSRAFAPVAVYATTAVAMVAATWALMRRAEVR